MSTLSVANGELMRLDICAGCWENGRAQHTIELAWQERAAAAAAAQAEAARKAERAARRRAGQGPGSRAEEGSPESSSEEGSPEGAAVVTHSSTLDDDGEERRDDLFWWFTRHVEGKKRSLQLDMASLERLFLELEGRSEPKLRELRYVLCLLLMRKRRLKVVRVERGPEGESFLVRRPRHEESLRVFVFDFDAARMDQLRADLQAIFDGAEEEGELRLPDPEPGDGEEVVDEDGRERGADSAGPSEDSEGEEGDFEQAENDALDDRLEPSRGGR